MYHIIVVIFKNYARLRNGLLCEATCKAFPYRRATSEITQLYERKFSSYMVYSIFSSERHRQATSFSTKKRLHHFLHDGPFSLGSSGVWEASVKNRGSKVCTRVHCPGKYDLFL